MICNNNIGQLVSYKSRSSFLQSLTTLKRDDLGLQVTSYNLKVTSWNLKVTRYKLQVTSYKLKAKS